MAFRLALDAAAKAKHVTLIPGEIARSLADETLTVRIDKEDAALWATIGAAATPPFVWVDESDYDFSPYQRWILEDIVDDDLAERLARQTSDVRQRLEQLRAEARRLASDTGPARLAVGTVAGPALYLGEYEADWAAAVDETVNAIEDILDPDEDMDDGEALDSPDPVAVHEFQSRLIDALVRSEEFSICTTQKQRLVYAGFVAERLDGYTPELAHGLEELAELAWVKQQARLKKASKQQK